MGRLESHLAFARQEAPLRGVEERVRDYAEVELPVAGEALRIQASRCMDCGIPFCHGSGCPLANRIPDVNERVFQGRWREASEILHATNNFPEITGRVCPAACESACTLGLHGSAVAIRNVERAVADRAWAEGWIRPVPPSLSTGRKVAVVGSGPAGLTTAQQLARLGHEVVVFERELRLGGLLRYGIPDFKLPKELIDGRIAQMEAEGVSFVKRVNIGDEVSVQYLQKRFDAMVLAVGAETPRDLEVPGRDLAGIHFALDYLGGQIRRNAGERDDNPLDAKGARVLVIGGGDTGHDCVETALRQGAREIHQVEFQPEPDTRLRPAALWPRALRIPPPAPEGVSARWGIATRAFEGEGGRVVRWHGMHRASGESCDLDVDMVILALGFHAAAPRHLTDQLGLELDAQGAIQANWDGATGVPGVFAAGDGATGPSFVVRAMQSGRMVAWEVDRFLKG